MSVGPMAATNAACLPRVLVLGLGKDADHLVKEIVGEYAEPLAPCNAPLQREYLWNITTKYYSCRVRVSAVTSQVYDLDEPPFELVEALIVYYDSDQVGGVKRLSDMESYLSRYNVDVKLLVCDDVSQAQRQNAIEWCVGREFELINLSAADDAEHAEEVQFLEMTGVERIKEALQVHVWSNAHICDARYPSTPFDGADNDAELDDFCALYSKLNMMKEGVAELPREQRLHCAEQIIAAFWSAIGAENEHPDELDDDHE